MFNDVFKVGQIAHAHHKAQLGGMVGAGFAQIDIGDIAFGAGDFGGERGQHTSLIGKGDNQGFFKAAHGFIGPDGGNEVFGMALAQFQCNTALRSVDVHTFALPQVTNDAFARYGRAARLKKYKSEYQSSLPS